MIQAIRGTRDLFGEELQWHRTIEATTRDVLEAAGAIEIQTPIFEDAAVFEKGVGATTDIVQHEMYTFTDRGGRRLVLRPEGTAGVMRAFLEHGMQVWPLPVKLYYLGPMFRAERPQKGRQRQFHQAGFESIGLEAPLADAEAIALLVDILKALGLSRFELKLSSLGDPEDRIRYNDYLRQALAPYANELSDDSRNRLQRNPMRILDSKAEADQAVLQKAGIRPILEFLGPEARAHFEAVQAHLNQLGIDYVVAPHLVRGLDYYRRTAFEVHHEGLGAQSALGGGGRYDGLTELLGGPSVPGIGWAIGIERLVLALKAEGRRPRTRERRAIYFVPLDEAAVGEALVLAQSLRPRIRAEFAYVPRRPAKGIKEAEKRGARWACFLGEAERARGTVTVKDLVTGEQHELARDALGQWVEGL